MIIIARRVKGGTNFFFIKELKIRKRRAKFVFELSECSNLPLARL